MSPLRNNSYRIPRKKSSVSTTKQVERHNRRQTAMALRMAGASYQDIVNADIGYKDTSHVGKDINQMLASFQYETPEDVLVLDLARLDEMQKIATSHMRTTDWSTAMSMLLRIMQFRRDTLGITPDVISNRRNDANALVNNGIMVVQGTASDFLDGMMQAAGASEKERKTELERVAKSNIIDAEVVENATESTDEESKRTGNMGFTRLQLDPDLDMEGSKKFVETFSEFADKQEQNDTIRESIPMLDLSQPILSTDLPQDEQTTVRRIKKLRIPAKLDDSNVNPTSGISYRRAPQKLDETSAQKVVRRKLVRSQKSSDVESMVDEIESETRSERF